MTAKHEDIIDRILVMIFQPADSIYNGLSSVGEML